MANVRKVSFSFEADDEQAKSPKADNEQPKSPEPGKPCVKLHPAKNFMAALDRKLDLYKETETIDCDIEILEKVFNNYVIVKNILKYLPWQDKFVCRDVSTLFRSTVYTLGREQLRQVDFSINLSLSAVKKGIVFKQSRPCYNLPLCVLMFCNASAINTYGTAKCMAILPHPCDPPCEKEHSVMDMIHRETAAPKPIMFITKAYNVSYLPLQKSLTYDNAIKKLSPHKFPFYCGFVIPLLKNVEFTTYSTPTAREHTEELKNDLRKLAEKNIIKAIIVNVTDHYMLYCGNGRNSFLDCFKEIQPNKTYALGGCLVEDTFAYQEDMDDVIAVANDELPRIICKQVSLAIFTIPKNLEDIPAFEVFSCVIEKAVWNKQQIQEEIEKFSKRIPHFANSIALKFSCAGRQSRHECEQASFRQWFPDTPQAGCFGNGEFGVNYPQQPEDTSVTKKPKVEIAYETLHSYSTVFMYFGWGKIVKPAEVETLKKGETGGMILRQRKRNA